MDKYDQWATTFNDPKIHEEDGCPKCHEEHLDQEQVDENCNKEFQCCIDQIAEWVTANKRCPYHPHSYYESALARENLGLGFKAMCEGCGEKK